MSSFSDEKAVFNISEILIALLIKQIVDIR